ncbi:triokinase/FMN cyclase-like [Dermatophagoides pteronyssinus]|uniref:triokinase/FMN cyclase-like n=1 Tax=Dermatophagoides pteronyssinus TaxID=6956 RepID=UPI003F66320E
MTESNGCKYLLNSTDLNIRHHLTGMARTNPNIQILSDVDGIVRKDIAKLKGRVVLISGGGAGHEPMFAGFVGPKQLTAAVSGSYFASPSTGAIMRLVEQITKPDSSILFITANYTGDRLNFGLANEYLRLRGYKNIEAFVFGDDLAPFLTTVAGGEKNNIQIKRRGLAGIVFVHRIAGVLSERGQTLSQILSYLNRISRLIYTFSVSLSAADIVGQGASFRLPNDQMELGLGVHGESGVRRCRLMSATETIGLMLNELIGHLDRDGILERYQRKVIVLINNLGGMIPMEMNIIANEVIEQLLQKSINIKRIYSGSLFTSFNMKGVSITIFIIDNDDILDILDEFDRNHAIQTLYSVNKDFIYNQSDSKIQKIDIEKQQDQQQQQCDQLLYQNICSKEIFVKCLRNACQSIINQETYLNNLDKTVGDSDCGSTLSSIARLILNQCDSIDVTPTFSRLSRLMINSQIGGTSGAIYSLLFTAAHNFIYNHYFQSNNDDSKKQPSGKKIIEKFWLKLIEYCMERLSCYGGARINDRSMIDGLNGIIIGLKQCLSINDDLDDKRLAKIISESTWHQAKSTITMRANVGRASYVNEKHWLKNPDAGAIAVAIWLQAIVDTLANNNSNKVIG